MPKGAMRFMGWRSSGSPTGSYSHTSHVWVAHHESQSLAPGTDTARYFHLWFSRTKQKESHGKHSKRTPPGITFLRHGLEHQGATKDGGSTLLQTVLVQGRAGHVSKVMSQASHSRSFPRALKRAPDSRDPLIFRLLCQDHQQRCKTLVFQHALVYQN